MPFFWEARPPLAASWPCLGHTLLLWVSAFPTSPGLRGSVGMADLFTTAQTRVGRQDVLDSCQGGLSRPTVVPVGSQTIIKK